MADSGEAWRDAEIAARFAAQRTHLIPHAHTQLDVILQILRRRPQPIERILDLGCGDGILVAALLDAFPSAFGIAVDYSIEMLARATERLAPYAGRAAVQGGDLRTPDFWRVVPGPMDVVVSGFAIHHLPDLRKRTLYSEIYLGLRPGGMFLNLEHVASSTPVGEALFDHAMVDFQIAQRRAAGESVDAERLWHEHQARPDKADNRLATVSEQCEWLTQLGFRDVDCFWKWYELALFGGQRPCS